MATFWLVLLLFVAVMALAATKLFFRREPASTMPVKLGTTADGRAWRVLRDHVPDRFDPRDEVRSWTVLELEAGDLRPLTFTWQAGRLTGSPSPRLEAMRRDERWTRALRRLELHDIERVTLRAGRLLAHLPGVPPEDDVAQLLGTLLEIDAAARDSKAPPAARAVAGVKLSGERLVVVPEQDEPVQAPERSPQGAERDRA